MMPKSKRSIVLETLRLADSPMPTRTVSAMSKLTQDEAIDALKALERKGIARRITLPRTQNPKASRFAWEYAR